ncbi:MAG: prepilin-type N-terminal cleavage/methylation domain-containing protein [Paracoccaceae bacterium]
MKESLRFRSDSGLTLLELLVALAIMAIIAAGLAQTLGQGIRVWEASKTVQSRQEPIILRTHLRNWVEQAVAPNRLLPHDNSFSGNNMGFSFLTLHRTPYNALAAAQRIRVYATIDKLFVTIAYLDDAGDQISNETRQLSDSTAIFSYFIRTSEGGEWTPKWSDEPTLPDLIRIESLDPNWPEFTVAPLLR